MDGSGGPRNRPWVQHYQVLWLCNHNVRHISYNFLLSCVNNNLDVVFFAILLVRCVEMCGTPPTN